ncbi:hypothetical protein EDD75_0407 [Thermodesulfitimonas autotrophica]|uniref:Uncharacterized protein n=1 Tax=Thermodesulfitimonas autotrophica TaxID=1894989 RepID=A0A3N5AX40_9THEO|nr:hypothetical protein [Thermodesulfitimonas autotrophica]RPF49589.1 hypothetical protein EDD75_0407 [Thermodesulfitimonas autotrophica]
MPKLAELLDRKTLEDLRALVRPEEKAEEKVSVTAHAVDRLLNGGFRFPSEVPRTREAAERLLARAVLKGRFVRKCAGGAEEVCWNDLYLVIRRFPDGKIVVLTVNGDRAWRGWWVKKETYKRFSAKALAAL